MALIQTVTSLEGAVTSASRVVTPFDRETTAAEVIAGVDLAGKRAIVTGATSGIGVPTAAALASAGAEVTIAVRDTERGKQVAADIAAAYPDAPPVQVRYLDLGNRASINDFVAAWDGPLHILVNNAGVMALAERTLTPEGWEYQFAVNHLGHFALTTGLLGALRAAGNARVVVVSSDSHFHSKTATNFDDLDFSEREYRPFLAYAQSKVANILFAVEADRRWRADGIRVNALHPGAIRSGLQKHFQGDPKVPQAMKDRAASMPWRSAGQGAATTVLLAASPLVEGVGGRYFENCNESPVNDPNEPPAVPDSPGVAPYALDLADAARLWDVSAELVATPIASA